MKVFSLSSFVGFALISTILGSLDSQPQIYHMIAVGDHGYFPICYDVGIETGGAVRLFSDDSMGLSITATTFDGHHIDSVNIIFKSKNFLINTKGFKVGSNELVAWENFRLGKLTSKNVTAMFEKNSILIKLETESNFLDVRITRREYKEGAFFLSICFPRLNPKNDTRKGIVGFLRNLSWKIENVAHFGKAEDELEEMVDLNFSTNTSSYKSIIRCDMVKRQSSQCCKLEIMKIIGHIDNFS
ncbi:DgyrCDS8711 [Dimorphilus gyrociliatus]|uniref:DgyrCDS8711 n=1 Tax=Dimorphilus gyrociliatus TaxID=2664684 RepID=A0A7I8VV15_9ANNE|nr:DgyrCDS8711 [Dimorphilus gyrociliatus]